MPIQQTGPIQVLAQDRRQAIARDIAGRLARASADSFLISYGLLDTNTVKLLAH